ncbi:MAG: restriction endonuclease [bacterium]|nr:restriction endonuclease [bacterium]
MPKPLLITKENGELERFDAGKLIFSLHRSGASDKAVNQIIRHIRGELYHGISTKDIYRHAYDLLRRMEKPAALRYSLKRAVLDLGPSGFPFEDFIGEIFKAKGFTVETGVIMQGSCVPHEVDLVASNEKKFIVGEVKFHNELGMKSDLKVALYVQARVDDLKKYRAERGERQIDEGWLITNSKFSKMAVQYANCKGMKVLSWTYPRFGNLQDLIEEAKIHPITALTTLTRQDKNLLLQNGIVLCKSIVENTEVFKKVGITGPKLERTIEEGRLLCSPAGNF